MANIVLSILGKSDGATHAVKDVESSVEGLKGHAHSAGAVMAGIFGGGLLLEGAEKLKEMATESVDKLGELADKTRTLQRTMGGSAEQVSAFIAVGDRFGVTSEQMAAGMGIADKAIVTGKDHFAAYGIATRDSQGHLLSMADMMPQVVAKISALKTPTEQAAAAQELFGKGGKAMLPILTMGTDKFAEYEESAKKAGTTIGGSAMDASFKYQQAQKELGEAVEGAQIKIGEKLYPTLISLTEWVTKNVIPAFQGMLSWISQNKDIVEPLVGVLAALGGIVLTIVAAVKAWAVIQEILDSELFANPIGLIVLAVIGLIAVIVLLVTHWRQVTDFLQTVWAAVTTWFRDTLNSIGKWWADTWNSIEAVFHTVWNALVTIFQNFTIAGLILTHLTQIESFFRTIWNSILNTFRTVWNTIVSFGASIVDGYIGGARSAWGGLSSFLHGLFSGIAGFIQSAWNGAVSFLQGIPGRITSVFAGMGTLLVNSGRSLIGGFASGITSAIGGAVSAVSSVVGAVAKFFPHSPAPEGPFSGQGWTHYSGAALMDGFAGGIVSRTGGLRTTMTGALSSLVPSMSMAGMGLAGAAGSASSVAGGGRGATFGDINLYGSTVSAADLLREADWNARVYGR